MGAVLEFCDVSYRIGGRTILRNVRLSVAAGETLVLLGRSGSGKTSLLRLANGLIQPSEGEVRFEGRPLAEWDLIRLRRRIGYVIQDAGLFPHFTAARNIGLVPRLEGWEPARIASRVEQLLEQMGLPPRQFSERRPRELSGGEKQRVGIARALAADPDLLLLDEPFAALDPVTRLELQKLFLALRREWNRSALFVTHDVREALMMASRIALLNAGRLELVAEPAEFRATRNGEARTFLAALEWEGMPYDAGARP